MSNFNSVLNLVYWLKANLPYSCDEFGLIPSIQHLSKLKGCSTTTMHKAIKVLCEENFLYSKHGLGTFIKRQNTPHTISSHSYPASTEKLNINTSESIVVLVPTNSHISLPSSKIIAEYLESFCLGAMSTSLENSIKITFQYIDVIEKNFAKTFRNAIQYIKKNRIQKIIAVGFFKQEIFQKLALLNLPCIIVDHWPFGLDLPSINPDYYSATKELVQLLASLKHTDICLIDRPNKNLNKEIMNGYLAGLESAGLAFNAKYIFNLNDTHFSKAKHIEELERLILKNNRPTAFICFSHLIVIEFLKLCSKWKISVPQDISLATYIHKDMTIQNYHLSGILFDWEKIGRIVVQKIVGDRQNKFSSELFGYTIIPGNTIAFRKR